MLIRNLLTTLLQIYFQLMFDFKISFESIIVQDNICQGKFLGTSTSKFKSNHQCILVTENSWLLLLDFFLKSW